MRRVEARMRRGGESGRGGRHHGLLHGEGAGHERVSCAPPSFLLSFIDGEEGVRVVLQTRVPDGARYSSPITAGNK